MTKSGKYLMALALGVSCPLATAMDIKIEEQIKSKEVLIKEDLKTFLLKQYEADNLTESEVEKITWKEKIKFKGDFGWNTDYDPSGNTIDIHKINSAINFQLGEYKCNLSGLTSTHIYDTDAKEEAKHRQPSSR